MTGHHTRAEVGGKNCKNHRYTGVLAVQVADIENGQRSVEAVLRKEAQKWQIDEIKRRCQ